MIEPNAHYELYESRGREPDQDEQDWLRAELELRLDRLDQGYCARFQKIEVGVCVGRLRSAMPKPSRN